MCARTVFTMRSKQKAKVVQGGHALAGMKNVNKKRPKCECSAEYRGGFARVPLRIDGIDNQCLRFCGCSMNFS